MFLFFSDSDSICGSRTFRVGNLITLTLQDPFSEENPFDSSRIFQDQVSFQGLICRSSKDRSLENDLMNPNLTHPYLT